jgi:hypothetical protein
MDAPHLIPTMTIVFCFVILALLVWFTLARKLAADKARHEVQLRLLQSAGSAAELTELMRSEEARNLLVPVRPVNANFAKNDSHRYAIRAVKTGVVLIFLGGGMSALTAISNRDWVVGAALALTGGLGLLASALVSVWLSGRFRGES